MRNGSCATNNCPEGTVLGDNGDCEKVQEQVPNCPAYTIPTKEGVRIVCEPEACPKGIQRFGPVCEFPFPCPEGMVRQGGICPCPHWEHQLADGRCVKDLEPLPSP